MSTTVKTVTRRDSATALLRKLGIKPRDYNLFIDVTADDTFAVKVGAAEKHLKDLTGPSPEELATKAKLEADVAAARTALAKKVGGQRRAEASKAAFRASQTPVTEVTTAPASGESCAAYARRLLEAGHSNAEMWVALVQHFNLDDKKRGYPAWYRWQWLKVKALIGTK